MTIPVYSCQDAQSTAVFCDTAAKCQTAASALETSLVLVLDCEGHNLGTSSGKLSLILLRDATADSQTYIIDALRLPLTSLRPILDLLRSPNIRKIVFDGRMDFSMLYHELGIELHNVLDLQLVDIMSRFTRGEGMERQGRRLRSWLKTNELRTQPQLYFQVHRLNGLDGCIAEHAIIPRTTGKPIKFKGEFKPSSQIRIRTESHLNFSRPQSLDEQTTARRTSFLRNPGPLPHIHPLRLLLPGGLPRSYHRRAEHALRLPPPPFPTAPRRCLRVTTPAPAAGHPGRGPGPWIYEDVRTVRPYALGVCIRARGGRLQVLRLSCGRRAEADDNSRGRGRRAYILSTKQQPGGTVTPDY
jgi:hypothetical protein